MNNEYMERFRKESLRKSQLKMLGILEKVDKVCKEQNITYWIEGGTLLGAMRHGGFIPWDDDLDISMMRDDYNRFQEVAADLLPADLFMQNRKTDTDFFHLECKIRDLNSYIADGGDDNSLKYQKGIFIDIFPYDEAPGKWHKFMGKIARQTCVADVALNTVHHLTWTTELQFLYFKMKLPILRLIWKLGTAMTRNGKFVAIDPRLSWCRAIHRRESIFPLTEVEFEGKKFPAPALPDEYLTKLYGNWRQIPPKEKQQIHSQIIIPQLVEE